MQVWPFPSVGCRELSFGEICGAGLRASTVWLDFMIFCFQSVWSENEDTTCLFFVWCSFNPESRVVTTFCQKSLQCQFGFCILKLKVLHLLHHAQSIVAEGFKNETRCCSLQKMNIEDSGEKSDTTHPGILTPPSTSSFVFCWGFGAITRQQSIVTSSAIKTGSC